MEEAAFVIFVSIVLFIMFVRLCQNVGRIRQILFDNMKLKSPPLSRPDQEKK